MPPETTGPDWGSLIGPLTQLIIALAALATAVAGWLTTRTKTKALERRVEQTEQTLGGVLGGAFPTPPAPAPPPPAEPPSEGGT